MSGAKSHLMCSIEIRALARCFELVRDVRPRVTATPEDAARLLLAEELLDRLSSAAARQPRGRVMLPLRDRSLINEIIIESREREREETTTTQGEA